MWQRIVNSFIFLLINKRIVVYGLLRRFTPRNDKKRTVIARTEGSWQSQYGIQLFIHGILFLFVFVLTFCGLWGFASLCKGGSCEATGGLRKN